MICPVSLVEKLFCLSNVQICAVPIALSSTAVGQHNNTTGELSICNRLTFFHWRFSCQINNCWYSIKAASLKPISKSYIIKLSIYGQKCHVKTISWFGNGQMMNLWSKGFSSSSSISAVTLRLNTL